MCIPLKYFISTEKKIQKIKFIKNDFTLDLYFFNYNNLFIVIIN